MATLSAQDIQLVKTGSTMAAAAYGDGSKPPGPEWTELSSLSVTKASGFQAKVYVNTTTGTPQIWVAVAGSNDLKDAAAWVAAKQGWNGAPAQFSDALQFGKELKTYLDTSPQYSNYSISTSGHSWGELFAQMYTYTFGWSGVGFDGVGAGAVINSIGFTQKLTALDITAVGGTGFISCNTAGLSIGPISFGGGFIGSIGNDISGTRQCTVDVKWGLASGAFVLGATVSSSNPLGILFGGNLLSGVSLHSMENSIDPAIQAGNFSVSPTAPATATPFIYDDGQGNILQTKTDASGNVARDANGQAILIAQAPDGIGGSIVAECTSDGKLLSICDSATPTSGTPDNLFTLTTDTIASTSGSTSGSNLLIHTGSVDVFGVGDVNADRGAIAVENYFITNGYRPGNGNLGSGLYSLDYADSLTYKSLDAIIEQALVNNYANELTSTIPADPLVLDLNGDGVKLTDYTSAPVLFDADNDGGSLEQTGWVDANDGIVVVDHNGNGKIDSIAETLSEYFNGATGTGGNAGEKRYANGLAALKSLDSNSDNQFTSADAAWSGVKVWVDANHDGKTDTGELKTLASLNVTSINLTGTTQSGLVRDGNEVLATSTFVMGGLTREAIAANFLTNPAGHTLTSTGAGTNNLITTQGGKVNGVSVSQSKTYVATNTNGETIDVATIVSGGVNNAYGSTGNDTLTGDANANWLVGNAGSDTFNAGAGDDVLLIDADDQQANLHAGTGNDIVQVVGDDGVTVNLAQAEAEIAQGGRGNDILIGGGRSSVFIGGGDGDDIVIGGAANDALSGENGADLIDGGAGNDVIRGHRGRDQLVGGAGDDFIQGGQDDDRLDGGGGADVLEGGQGDDMIDGGDGQDAVQMRGSYAEYKVVQLQGGAETAWRIVDTVAGRDGADIVKNVESITFKDISNIEFGISQNPRPVKDVLTVDSNGNAFTRIATTRIIAKSQLLGNDIDWQGDVLHITAITDTQGGTATLNANGDVVFTPAAGYTGIMGFKYQIADAANHQAYVQDTATGVTALMKGVVWLKTADVPNDPLATDQWYLSEANILPVWADYTGKGVCIGEFEAATEFATTQEVLDYHHPDLAPNIDPSWLANATPGQLAGEGADGQYSSHATLVAGVIGAARNGEGGVGVAYNATIAEYSAQYLEKMGWHDIANNSWGYGSAFFCSNFDAQATTRAAFVDAVTKGRDGLGTAIVMAAGNERAAGGNANYEAVTNNRFSIAVGAVYSINDLGALQTSNTPFGNPGANLLTSAPASNVTSTSRLVESESGSTFGVDYDTAQGTSFSAPIVSGVIALMLEANPKLGYRDIQAILALVSKKVTDTNTTWQDNHATNWNGGAMHVSHDYGFGEIDARATVRLAETWTTQQTYSNELGLATPISSGVINTAITDNNAIGINSTLTVSGASTKVEHAEVTVNLTHANAGDLIIKLVSPTGTESILMNRPGKAPGSDATDTGDAQFYSSNTLNFTFTTVRDWSESANGIWTLKIIDSAAGNTGTLESWSLNLYGAADNGDDTYFYTDEYKTVALTRRTLAADTDGGRDTINAAAAQGNSTVNLTTGIGTIAGTALTMTTPANIENTVGGEGDDTLTGNAASNMLVGGRGNDTLSGGAGGDILWGNQGNDTLTGGTGVSVVDAFVIDKQAGATDTITDFELGTDRLVLSGFGSTTGTAVTWSQVGVNTQINLGDGQTVVLQNITSTLLNTSQIISITDGVAMRDLESVSGWSFGTDSSDAVTSLANGGTAYWAGAGTEQVYGGTGNDRIYGGAGNDTIIGEASTTGTTGGNDLLYGEDGSDSIYGGGGNDTLYGGAGNDLLDGGYGDDVLNLEGDDGLSSYSGLSLQGSTVNGTYVGDLTISGATLNGATAQGGAGNDRFVVLEDMSITASQGLLRNIVADFDPFNASEKIDLSGVRAVTSFGDLQYDVVTATVAGGNQTYLRKH